MTNNTPNIRFLEEAEKNDASPFLDIEIYKENRKFVTSVYRKETPRGVYLILVSFIQVWFIIHAFSSVLLFSFGFFKVSDGP